MEKMTNAMGRWIFDQIPIMMQHKKDLGFLVGILEH